MKVLLPPFGRGSKVTLNFVPIHLKMLKREDLAVALPLIYNELQRKWLNDRILVSPVTFNYPAGTYIMVQIIAFTQVTDLDPGNGSVNKTIII